MAHTLPKLILPVSDGTSIKSVDITSNGPIVIIGGNGSGKSRLGAYLEKTSSQKNHIHRLSAQRSLQMPEQCRSTSSVEAHNDLLFGRPDQISNIQHKIINRWKNKPESYPLNDYEKLMVYLFSEDWEISTKYRQDSIAYSGKIHPPQGKLDIIKQIWEKTLPHSSLHILGGKIEVSPRDSNSSHYSGSGMSDGERVIIYLIGQVLSAPTNGIIIIDEPEIHLHKAILSRLWDNIEAERPDCLFVYLTHDLEFAATRKNATKICIRDYDGKTWNWFQIPLNSQIPEELLLQIVGSRKPVLFVEGTNTSIDYNLFLHSFPNHTVIPRGSCTDVIHSTVSFASLSEHHRLDCCGIVDCDLRSDEDIAQLLTHNIHVLRVAEIENIFLLPDILRIVGSQLEFTDIEPRIEKAKATIISSLAKNIDTVVSSITNHTIDSMLKKFNTKSIGEQNISQTFTTFISSFDIQQLYRNIYDHIKQIVDIGDYEKAITIYSNKGLLPTIAPVFDLTGTSFRNLLLRMVASKENHAIISALKVYLPDL